MTTQQFFLFLYTTHRLCLLSLEVEAEPVFGHVEWPIGVTVISFALSLWYPRIAVPFCFLMDDGSGDDVGITCSRHDALIGADGPTRQMLNRDQLPIVRSVIDRAHHRFVDIYGSALRYYWAGHRERLLDAIVDYVIAFEGLLARGVQRGIGATLRKRTGALLATNSAEIEKWQNTVRDLYDLRSKIVHGAIQDIEEALKPFGGTAGRAAHVARDTATRVFAKFLQRPELLQPGKVALLDRNS